MERCQRAIEAIDLVTPECGPTFGPGWFAIETGGPEGVYGCVENDAQVFLAAHQGWCPITYLRCRTRLWRRRQAAAVAGFCPAMVQKRARSDFSNPVRFRQIGYSGRVFPRFSLSGSLGSNSNFSIVGPIFKFASFRRSHLLLGIVVGLKCNRGTRHSKVRPRLYLSSAANLHHSLSPVAWSSLYEIINTARRYLKLTLLRKNSSDVAIRPATTGELLYEFVVRFQAEGAVYPGGRR